MGEGGGQKRNIDTFLFLSQNANNATVISESYIQMSGQSDLSPSWNNRCTYITDFCTN